MKKLRAPDDKRRWYISLHGENVSRAIRAMGIPQWRSLVSMEKGVDFACLLFEDEYSQLSLSTFLIANDVEYETGRADAFDWYLYDRLYWSEVNKKEKE